MHRILNNRNAIGFANARAQFRRIFAAGHRIRWPNRPKGAKARPGPCSLLGIAGAGLGNAFLSHIAAVDGIYHLVRAFDSDEVIHVDDNVDPIRDLETIQGELCAKVCVVETKYFFKLITLQPSHLLNFTISSFASSFLFAPARR